MAEGPADSRIQSLVAAHAVLHSVEHILSVSTDLEDAKRQVQNLVDLVREKVREEQVPQEMLREAGREMLMELL